MSTYHYLVCDDHKKYIGAVNMSVGTIKPFYDNLDRFHEFILRHSGCNVRILIEHDMEDVRENYENVEKDEG